MQDSHDIVRAATVPVRPLRRIEYDRLVESGAFDGEPLELLGGSLVRMSPQDLSHSFAIQELAERLGHALRGRALVRCQLPFALDDASEPEPDLAVVPLREDRYRSALPDHAHLLIEVAQTSLGYDARVKAKLYARANVPEYWVVDLVNRCVHVHTQPGTDGYDAITELPLEAELRPAAFADVVIAVRDLF